MEKQDNLAALIELARICENDPEDFFESAIGFIQYEAVQKGIEFDGYFQTKWEIEAEHPMTFDEEYFENEERSELYVYLAALIDKDTFDYLSYVWMQVNGEVLTENVLHREIYLLKEQGVKF